MSEVRDISVDYRDKSIEKSLRWDNTPLHETNNVSIEKSLAKFADVLQDLKKEVDRNELFTLLEIFRWVYEKHNLPIEISQKTMIQYRNTANKRKKLANKLIMRKKKTPATGRTEVFAISLSDWEYNRNILIQTLEEFSKNPMLKPTVEYKYKNYTKIGSWFYCFDYFFNHIKEYKTDKIFFNIEWENKVKILNELPHDNESIYILHRIIKNCRSWVSVMRWLNDTHFRKKSIRKIIKTKITGNVKYLCYSFFGFKVYDKKSMYLYSEKQIEALVWIRDNFNKKYPYVILKKDKETNINVFFNILRDFLKNKQHYIEKYDCLFEQDKVYRSLWL